MRFFRIFKNNKKAQYLYLLTLLIIPNYSKAESFSDAVKIGLGNNARLKSENLQLSAIKEQKIQATNLRRPNIQIDAESGVEHLDINNNGFGSAGTSKYDFAPRSISISASQPIFLGGKVEANLKSANLRYNQQAEKIRAIELYVIKQITTAYADLIKAVANYEVKKQSVEIYRQQLNESKANWQAGFIGKADVALVETKFNNANYELEASHGQLMSALTKFEQLLGQKTNGNIENNISISIPKSLDECLEIALQNNNELKYTKYNREIYLSEAERTKTEYAPSLSLNATASKYYDANYYTPFENDAKISAKLTIPIWNGGQTSSKARAFYNQADAASYDEIDEEKQLRSEISTYWSNIVTAKAQATIAKNLIDSAQIAKEGYNLERHYGFKTLSEALSQDQALIDAKSSLIEAKYQQMINAINLSISMGIDPTNNINHNIIEANNNEKYGIPYAFEAPIIYLQKLAQPLDSSITNKAISIRDKLRIER